MIQKSVQKQKDGDRDKNKMKIKVLQEENQKLKALIRQKQIYIITIQEQFTQKFRKLKESFQTEKRNLICQLEAKLNEVKSKVSDSQTVELKNLVSRQNKALKIQNQKFEEILTKNEILEQESKFLQNENIRKGKQCDVANERMNELLQKMEEMQQKLWKEEQNNKRNMQLEEVRRRMGEIQKGQIQRIELIVNKFQ